MTIWFLLTIVGRRCSLASTR